MSSCSVSVVVASYNDGDVLPGAIDNVLDQTLVDFELIVVDDGSTDDTATVVESYDDERIRFHEHVHNRGAAAARNTGLELASGDYIAFLDADDRWHSEKLERQIDCLDSRSPEWVAVYCDVQRAIPRWKQLERAVGRLLFRREEIPEEGGTELIKYVLTKKFEIGSTSTLCVRRNDAIELGGFDEQFRRHTDLEFLIRLLQHGKLAYVDEPLVEVHGHSEPDMQTVIETKHLYLEKFSDHIDSLEGAGYDIRDRHLLQISRRYFQSGMFREGANHLSWSYVSNPGHLLRLLWSVGIGVSRTVRCRFPE